jgi:hypothetical protein
MLIHLLALNDGTDEIFNIASLEIEVRAGESAKAAFERYMVEEYAECWKGNLSFGDDEEANLLGYREWMEERFYLPSLFDPDMIATHQNAQCDEVIKVDTFMPLDTALKMVDAIVAVKVTA